MEADDTGTGTGGGGGDAPAPAAVQASYTLVSSYTTVQVLAPTVINDVVYCTIQSQPSGVIASMPVAHKAFDTGDAAAMLAAFADAIETVMADARVTAGVGAQSLDSSGLLTDSVIFTVEYIDSAKAPNGVTAQVSIPNGQLNFSDAANGSTLQAGVMAKIDAVYGNLKAAAGG